MMGKRRAPTPLSGYPTEQHYRLGAGGQKARSGASKALSQVFLALEKWADALLSR